MTISDKISRFLDEKGVTYTELGEKHGSSPQNISKMLRKNGKVPLDFILFLIGLYPEIDLNALIKPGKVHSIVSEEREKYGKDAATKDEILSEIGKILDKYL